MSKPPSCFGHEDEDDSDAGDPTGEGSAESGSRQVALLQDRVPHDLKGDTFFERLIGAALDRMPIAVYPEVRRRMEAADEEQPA